MLTRTRQRWAALVLPCFSGAVFGACWAPRSSAQTAAVLWVTLLRAELRVHVPHWSRRHTTRRREVLSVYAGSLFPNLKMLCNANAVKAVWGIAGSGKTVFQCVPAVGRFQKLWNIWFHGCHVFLTIFLSYLIPPLGFSEVFTKSWKSTNTSI